MSFLDKPKVGDAKTIVKEHIDELKHMQLYRQDFNEQEVILEDDLNLSNQWLGQSYLRFEAEGLICAAQEQALKTRYVRSTLWRQRCSQQCK